MKRLKIVLFLLVLVIGVGGAFAGNRLELTRDAKQGYTWYYAVSTDGIESHYRWSKVRPIDDPYYCVVTNITGQHCTALVNNSYTPQANTPIPDIYAPITTSDVWVNINDL